ncbi:MAG: thiamine pyrophosphate-binding protein, partial [Alphaproteobacteria bacterium]|nr:thiamine pyrophosphate-binding protein [Alphaproteobacteria bacterium]
MSRAAIRPERAQKAVPATKSNVARTGGQILVDSLLRHGVTLAFCVPGESYLAALDALHDVRDRLKLIVCRHESGVTNMAEAYGKVTGRPGIAFVTRGPGATNAAVGIHTAFQDSTPLIMFVGDVARDQREREAFQEVDFPAFFRPLAKWAARIEDPARIPEFVARAFQTATSGRMGPVVLALPEDMLTEAAVAAETAPYRPIQPMPSPADLYAFRDHLAGAKRPLLIVGGSGWTARAVADITAFAEANKLPVSCAWRGQDCFDNAHPHYVGDTGLGMSPALAERVKESDLLIVAGPRLGEMTTQGYTLLDVPVPKQKLVHVLPSAEELGRVYQPTLAVLSAMPGFAAAARALQPVDAQAWAGRAAEMNAAYKQTLVP